MIDIDTTGLDQVIAALVRLERRHDSILRDVADDLHSVFLGAERRLFSTQGASGGRRWQPLKTSTRRQKVARGYGSRINERTGDLKRSLTQARDPMHLYRVLADRILMGTRVRYAGHVHAQRPIIQITQADVDEMAQVLGRRLMAALAGGR